MDDLKKTVNRMAAVALICIFAAIPASQAADVSVGEVPIQQHQVKQGGAGTALGLGLGLGVAPDYEGSDDYAGAILPYVSVVFSNQMSFQLLANKAKFNLLPSAIWKAGLIGEYIPERDDVDDNKVDRLDDVDTSIMLGGFFGFEYNNWNAGIEAMADVADGNDGAIVRLSGGYRIPFSDVFGVGLGIFTTWADEDYMESYFGINAANSAASGLSTFDADEGFKDVGLNVTATHQPWQHWGLMGLLGYKRLLNDAEDSPVVDDRGDRNQFSAAALVFYKF